MVELITENLELWSSTYLAKKTVGRGSSTQPEAYGIKKLRELILELAVRGKLVPQDPNDEPASILLEKIELEKKRLIEEGKIKKQIRVAELTAKEMPFTAPNGWEFSRIGTTLNSLISGGTPSKNNPKFWNGNIPWASVKDLGQSKYIETTQDFITEEGLEAGSKLAETGDVLICTRMGLGKIAICKKPIAINQDLKAVRLTSHFDVDYFLITFATLNITGTGTTVSGIKQDQLLNIVIPLPPFEEQKRIVSKVNELMALCNRLEAHQTDSIEAHQTLVETLLNTLTASKDAQEFQESWKRIAEHFDTLFTTEQSIETLKQTILQLAVMGKLVPQYPNDEPASVLLEKIEAKKEQLVKEEKIKKQKKLPEISDDEKLFDLPMGWEWARLHNVIDVRDGTHDSPKDAFGNNTFPLVTSKNFMDGDIDFDNARRISEQNHYEIAKRSFVEKYDILFSMIGGNLGNQVMVKDDREFSVKNVALFKYYDKEMTLPFFIKKFMEHLALDLQAQAIGGAQPFVSLGFLRKLVIALPPMNEQHRIVAKVDELMALCDTLQKQLEAAQITQIHLADAIVEQAIK